MQIRYFDAAWNDIKNSQGWFGKLCLLALINFIPIFGQIVTMGYLYGWAREMAWGVHEPLPESIFSNEDGKLYRRGFFILIVGFVLSLIPLIIVSVGTSMTGFGAYSFDAHRVQPSGLAMVGTGTIIMLIGSLLTLFINVLAWVGYMRTSIYDRISAGLQLGKIWRMIRHDGGGILRVFGMNLLVSLIISVVLSIIGTVVVMIMVLGAAVGAGGLSVSSSSESVIALVLAAGGVGIILMIALVYFALVAQMFLDMLTARAMGYWTMQFDVPHWRGQDEPMPFEAQEAAYAAQAQAQAQPVQVPMAAQPMQQPGVQPNVPQQVMPQQPIMQGGAAAVPVAAAAAAAVAVAAQPANQGAADVPASVERAMGDAPASDDSSAVKPIVVGLDFFAEPEDDAAYEEMMARATAVDESADDAGLEERDALGEAAIAAMEDAGEDAGDVDAEEPEVADAAPQIAPPGMSAAEFEASNKGFDEPEGGEEE